MYNGHESINQANLPSYRKGEFFKALPASALADLEPLKSSSPSTHVTAVVWPSTSPKPVRCSASHPR